MTIKTGNDEVGNKIVVILNSDKSQQIQILKIHQLTFDAAYSRSPSYYLFIRTSFCNPVLGRVLPPFSIGSVMFQENEYKSSQFLKLLINYVSEQTSYSFDNLTTEDSAAYDGSLRESILGAFPRPIIIHIPLYGGWNATTDQNFPSILPGLQYIPPINKTAREKIKEDPLWDISIVCPCVRNLSVVTGLQIRSLLDSFKTIRSPQKRLFLFLYLHYCYTASLFSFSQAKDILHISINDPSMKTSVLNFIQQSFVCDCVSSRLPSREFRAIYGLSKDIPFFILETPSQSNRYLINKINHILYVREEITSTVPIPPHILACSNCQLCSSRCHYYCFNRNRPFPILVKPYAIPIIIRDTYPQESGMNMIHLSFDHDDFSKPSLPAGNVNPGYLHMYMNALKLHIYSELRHREVSSITALDNPLYFIFDVLYKSIKNAFGDPQCFNNSTSIDLNKEMEFEGEIKDYLDMFLPTLRIPTSFKSLDFINALQAAQKEGRIQCHKRLTDNPVLTHSQIENSFIVFIEENHWLINKPTFDLICESLPTPHKSSRCVVQTLQKDGFLESSNINDSSYQKRYDVVIFDASGKTTKKYPFYSIRIKEPVDEKIIASDDRWYEKPDGYHLYFGKDTHNMKEIFADINSEETNRHIMISGQSGSGKSYLLNKLISQAAEQGISTFVLLNQGEPPSNKVDDLISVFEKKPNFFPEGDSINSGIELFTYLKSGFRLNDCHLSSIQQVFIEYCRQNKQRSLFHFTQSFDSIARDLKIPGYKSISKKLSGILVNKLFSGEAIHWNDYLKKTVVIDLREYETAPVLLKEITEVILWSLYHYKSLHSERDPVIIVADEFQKYNTTEGSALNTILTEGRKHNLILWMASQTANSGDSKFKEISRQTEFSFYFQSDPSRNRFVGNLLGNHVRDQNLLKQQLNELKRGDYLLYRQGFPPIFGHYPSDSVD